METTAATATPNAFYSDPVDVEIDRDLISNLTTGLIFINIQSYKDRIAKHLATIDAVVGEMTNVENLHLKFHLERKPTSPMPELKLILHGQKPWDQNKIDEFNAALVSENKEIEQLKALQAKYPEKAAFLLATMDTKSAEVIPIDAEAKPSTANQ